MANQHAFLLEVATQERIVYSDRVTSVVAPGVEGSFGVLAGHAPLVAALDTGEIFIRDAQGQEVRMAVDKGFLEVSRRGVMVLGDTAELAREIDMERARQAVQRAEDRLRGDDPELDTDRARAALRRALNRMKVASR